MRIFLIVFQIIILIVCLVLTIPFLFFVQEARWFGFLMLLVSAFVAYWLYSTVSVSDEEFKRNIKTAQARQQLSKIHPMVVAKQQQVMIDTLQILASSKNVATVESRLRILHKTASDLISLRLHPQYDGLLVRTVDNYKLAYYDQPLLESTLIYMNDPGALLGKWQLFREVAIFNAFSRYAMEQKKYIETLKGNSAKARRLDKVIGELDTVMQHFTQDGDIRKLQELKIEFLQMRDAWLSK